MGTAVSHDLIKVLRRKDETERQTDVSDTNAASVLTNNDDS